jgi:hypothetical protein
MLDHPVLALFPFSLIVLWLAARIGLYFRRHRPLNEDEREEFGFVQAATLTLLGLIIGFTFSMAVGRYDQRKNYEEEEANAIGTEYLRAGLLPSTEAAQVHALLKRYLELRISYYEADYGSELHKINADTAKLQAEMWLPVQAAAAAQPTCLMTIVVSGMNDVLNSQGYAQAAWWNRIPTSAWYLMMAIAFLCNVLIGYGGRHARIEGKVIFILPLFVAISFLLISDIDSPRSGFIRVAPQNLLSLSRSL